LPYRLPSPQAAAAGNPQAAAAGSSGGGDWDFSFHDFVSIVNPLQHIPVVSTLYRKLTGDTIKPLERIAGDTLYGGWTGLVSSVANLVFEKETGKDFGDTVLAFLQGGDKDTGAAATLTATAAQPATAQSMTDRSATPQPTGASGADAGQTALASSIAGVHIDAALGQRAIYAYRHAIGMAAVPLDAASAF
jgi:hypothetical protein